MITALLQIIANDNVELCVPAVNVRVSLLLTSRTVPHGKRAQCI